MSAECMSKQCSAIIKVSIVLVMAPGLLSMSWMRASISVIAQATSSQNPPIQEEKPFDQKQALENLRKKIVGQENKPSEDVFMNTQIPIEGEWAGGFRIDRKWGFIKIKFIASEKSLSGIAEYPPENAIGLNLTQVGWQSPNLHFQLPRKAGTFVFDGQLKEGAISGTVRLAGARAAFRPRRGGGLVAHKSGQWVWLYFLSETSLLSELGETIAFVKNEKGEVINLTVRQSGTPDKPANRVKLYTPEEVSFRNRDVSLAGTLLIPNKPGPHPVVVMLHGSGPQNRSFGFITNFIARHGIAALAYDKRGVGASTGDWRKSSFDDLAGDALAGVQFLHGHKEINSKQIGLVGASQGGGIAHRAAARSSEIAFVVSVCSGLEPELKQDLYQDEWLLRHLAARPAEDKAGVIELVKILAGPERILPTEDKDQASALDFLKSVSEFGSTGVNCLKAELQTTASSGAPK
jgi:uncharacterized protein